MAICFPLYHSSILTVSVVVNWGADVMMRGLREWVPSALWCPGCASALVRSSPSHTVSTWLWWSWCADTRVNHVYGLFAAFCGWLWCYFHQCISTLMIWSNQKKWVIFRWSLAQSFWHTCSPKSSWLFMPLPSLLFSPTALDIKAPNGTCHVSHSLISGASHAQPHHLWS